MMKNRENSFFCLPLLIFSLVVSMSTTVFAGINCLGQSNENIGVAIANGLNLNHENPQDNVGIFVATILFLFVSQYIVFVVAWVSAKSKYRKNKLAQDKREKQANEESFRILQNLLQRKEYDQNVIPMSVIKKAKSEMRNRQ